MHIDLLKIIGGFIGSILFFKIIFWIFDPSEVWVSLFIYILTFGLYGIQTVEWAEKSNMTLLGLDIYNAKKVQQQVRIFGLIPIGKVRTIDHSVNVFQDERLIEQIEKEVINKITMSLLPGGGYKSSIIK